MMKPGPSADEIRRKFPELVQRSTDHHTVSSVTKLFVVSIVLTIVLSVVL